MLWQINARSEVPVYEQIMRQVRQAVLVGRLTPGEQLPSIRLLARELGVAVITVKRAYDDLATEGVLDNRPGSGCFVSAVDTEAIRRAQLDAMADKLRAIRREAAAAGIDKSQLMALLEQIGEEEP